jgi:HSP20 family protein
MENKLTRRNGVSPLFNRLNLMFEDMMDFQTDKMTYVGVNLKETDTNHQIQLSAPGYKKENFKIDIKDNLLTVSNNFTDEKSSENGNYSYKEFKRSSFSRSFYLTDDMNTDEINAKYEDGILYIDIPKSEKRVRTKSIEVR